MHQRHRCPVSYTHLDAANRTYCFGIDASEQPTPTATPTLLPTRTGSDTCEPNGRLTTLDLEPHLRRHNTIARAMVNGG